MKYVRQIFRISIAAFCFFHFSSASAESQIYIKAGEAKVKKSLMALPQFNLLSTPGVAAGSNKTAKDIFDTVLYDLSVSSYFDFIKPEAFLEDTSKVGLRPAPGEPHGSSLRVRDSRWRASSGSALHAFDPGISSACGLRTESR